MRLTPAEIWLILLGAFIAVCLLILLMGEVADRIEEEVEARHRYAARVRALTDREEVYK